MKALLNNFNKKHLVNNKLKNKILRKLSRNCKYFKKLKVFSIFFIKIFKFV